MPRGLYSHSVYAPCLGQVLLGRLTYCLIGLADSYGRFEGLLHIKGFTGRDDHPGDTGQFIG
jgi:hypothetical protein